VEEAEREMAHDSIEATTTRLPPRRGPRLASRFPWTVRADVCRDWVLRIEEARDVWTPNFGGVQYTLGRAWYTHLEEDRADDYFAGAAASDDLVERVLPGFQRRMLGIATDLVGSPVVRRPGWCGPGVHVFPPGSEVAERGGEPHFDTEGLFPRHRASRAAALSLVLMLQPPERGGGIAVWDATYAGSDAPPDLDDVRREEVDYRAGELVVIESYRLHQILPFHGTRARISATLHLVEEDGDWLAWF
jgi:hypothetical protein